MIGIKYVFSFFVYWRAVWEDGPFFLYAEKIRHPLGQRIS